MAIEFLLNSGMPYKRRGNELIYKVCSECGNSKFNLQVNLQKGFYHCWACDRGGRLRGLSILTPGSLDVNVQDYVETKVVAVPDSAEPISLSKKGLSYLDSRGIKEEDIRQLGVLYDNKENLYVPYYTGEFLSACNIRLKSGRWDFIGDSRESLFYIIYGKTEYVVICEGFFDGVKLMQTGHSVFILFGKILYEKQLKRLLQIFDKIILATDNDQWGRAARLKIAKQLENRVSLVYMLKVPEGKKDFGECTNEEIKGIATKKFGLFEKLNLKLWSKDA